MDELRIKELAPLAKSGDPDAFAEIFNICYPYIYSRYALPILRRQEDAEEATSDVFMKVWRHFNKWNPAEGEFIAWLTVLAKRRIIDAKRSQDAAFHKNAYLITIDELALMESVPCPRYQVLEVLVLEERIEQIEEALFQVSNPNHRLAWMLRHFEDYSQKEIAAIMRSPLTSVKMWIHRCNKHIQKHFGGGI